MILENECNVSKNMYNACKKNDGQNGDEIVSIKKKETSMTSPTMGIIHKPSNDRQGLQESDWEDWDFWKLRTANAWRGKAEEEEEEKKK